MLTPTPQPRRRGFSLIELLVVMAIMATLMGLGMGGYLKVRNVSGRIVCTNNLRQIYFGLQDYVDSSTDKLYPDISILKSPNSQNLPTLPVLLDPDKKTPNMFKCPMDTQYFPTEQNSYEYQTRIAKRSYTQLTNRRGKSVNPESIKILYDFMPVHGGSAASRGTNFLYLDGHVSN